MNRSDPDLKSLIPGPRLIILHTSHPELLGKSLVSLANAEGDRIVVGLDDVSRTPTGLLTSAVEEDLRAAQAQATPFIPVTWREEETLQGPLVVLQVESSRHLHSLIDGRIFRRSGTVNRVLLGPELQSLLRTRPSATAEEQPVFGAAEEDLDPDLIQEFRKLRQDRSPMQAALPTQDFLQQMGALDPDRRPTLSGLLLFGRDPQAFLPFAQVVFVSFKKPAVDPRWPVAPTGTPVGRR